MTTVSDIIDRFGGTSAVAKELGLRPSVVSSWRGANHIPAWRQQALLALALDKQIELSATDFPAKPAPVRSEAA